MCNLNTVDAAYEGTQKRTFLAMVLLVFTHLPFLFGIIVFYKKLKHVVHHDGYSKLDQGDDNTDESDIE